MTPEEAIVFAQRVGRRYRRFESQIESEAIYAYLVAMKSWRPDGGTSLRRYLCRRMVGAMRDTLRAERGRKTYAEPMGDLWWVTDKDEEENEPGPILRLIAGVTSRKAAIAAWLYWGLEYTLAEAGFALGLTESRVSQMLREVQKKAGTPHVRVRHKSA